jgi:hypothetical protein
MSENNKPMEMSAEELDVVAGGNGGIEQILEKDLDATFQQNVAVDRRVNAVGPDGAVAIEETALKQTRTDLSNDLFAKNV